MNGETYILELGRRTISS